MKTSSKHIIKHNKSHYHETAV